MGRTRTQCWAALALVVGCTAEDPSTAGVDTRVDTGRETGVDTGAPTDGLVAAVPELGVSPVKMLDVRWSDPPGVTHLQVLQQARDGDTLVPLGEEVAAGVGALRVPSVPLFAVHGSEYVLRACDAERCVDSDPARLDGSLTEGVGYVKALNPASFQRFGVRRSVALSADGSTLVVGAHAEGGAAVQVGGDPSAQEASESGAVYVYDRAADGTWLPTPTYVKASNTEEGDTFGAAVALSADGSVLAVGATHEDGGGLVGTDNSRDDSGAVYVYERDEAGRWSDAFYIKASTNPDAIRTRDRFGTSLALSDDGAILAVGAPGDSGSGSNLAGDPAVSGPNLAGAVYIFTRDAAGGWRGDPTYVKASNPDEDDLFGTAVALSSDGRVLAVGAPGEDSEGLTGANNDVQSAGAAYIYTLGEAGWSDAFYLKASTDPLRVDAGDRFGDELALSGDGAVLAIGVPGEDSASIDGVADPTDNSVYRAGAVLVFRSDGRGGWGSVPAFLKAPASGEEDFFGRSLSLSTDGRILAVGAPRESGGAVGVGGPVDAAVRESGAVVVFESREPGAWPVLSYVKAPRRTVDLGFGDAVVLSGDGATLAVGAPWEDGGGSGIGADVDESLNEAGAVFLY